MNTLLWTMQIVAALMYGASGIMKIFLFEKVSADVPSFRALPRQAWSALGVLELLCTVGMILPGAIRWSSDLTVVAAAALAVESLVFIWVHFRFRETTAVIFSCILGLFVAFIAYGRMFLKPHF